MEPQAPGNKDLLFAGDLNPDFKKWIADNYSLKQLVEILKELQADYGLQQLKTEYTNLV